MSDIDTVYVLIDMEEAFLDHDLALARAKQLDISSWDIYTFEVVTELPEECTWYVLHSYNGSIITREGYTNDYAGENYFHTMAEAEAARDAWLAEATPVQKIENAYRDAVKAAAAAREAALAAL